MGVNWLTKQLIKRKWTHRWMVPLSKWYATKMGYRQLGLKLEDLLPEESEVMQLALKRLPPKEAYDRVFRLRRAFQVRSEAICGILRVMLIGIQLSLSHQILPESQWTTYEEVRTTRAVRS